MAPRCHHLRAPGTAVAVLLEVFNNLFERREADGPAAADTIS
jgi:hypothetical protein